MSYYSDYAEKRKKDQEAAKKVGANSGYTSGGAGSSAPSYGGGQTSNAYVPEPNEPRQEVDYASMIANALREQREAEAAKLQASINKGVNTLNAQKPELEKQYQNSAQQAYIQNMMAKRDLPQTMAAQGLGGGVHESSLMGLDSTYGNGLNTLKDGYNSSVNAVDRDVANLQATGDISLAENSGKYAQLLQQAAQEAQAAQLKASMGYSTSKGAGNQNISAVLKNPYVSQAEKLHDPTATPGEYLDYVSEFVTDDELQQLIAYYGIGNSAVRTWMNGGSSKLPPQYNNILGHYGSLA